MFTLLPGHARLQTGIVPQCSWWNCARSFDLESSGSIQPFSATNPYISFGYRGDCLATAVEVVSESEHGIRHARRHTRHVRRLVEALCDIILE